MKRLVITTLIIGSLSGALIYTIFSKNYTFSKTQKEANITESSEETNHRQPNFETLLVSINQENRTIYKCDNDSCSHLATPPDIDNYQGVTDGPSWYHYLEKESKKILTRTWADKDKSITIAEQTDLVSPRELIISPDGQKVAYWLDNINDQEKSHLTELWAYDANEGGTKLLAENLSRVDITTPVRWNRSSNQTWFLGDTSKPDQPDQIELLVTSLKPPKISSRFASADWAKLKDIVAHGLMDISFTGRSLAYVDPKSEKNQLVIIHEGLGPATTSVNGQIKYLQWLENSSLLYVVQNDRGFSIWTTHGTIHRQLAYKKGQILSVSGNSSGSYIALAIKDSSSEKITVFGTNEEKFYNHSPLPTSTEQIFLVNLKALPSIDTINDNITTTLDASQIAAFIDKQIAKITNNPKATPTRIIVTDQPNTIFVDYQEQSAKKRLLLTINDAIHPEWTIHARWVEETGEWTAIQGGGLTLPEPQEVFEWEESLNQWILKEDLSKD
jgi:hypothetical protein